MIIRRIELENWRSFRGPVSAVLSPLTLLIGPNNAGKTNLIQALDSLRVQVAQHTPHHSHLGDPRYVFHSNSDRLRISVELVQGNKHGTYSLELRQGPGAGWTESFNSTWSTFKNGSGIGNGHPGISHVVDPRVRALHEAITGFRIWRLAPAAIDAQSPVLATVRLAPDGSNAAAMLDFLKDTNGPVYEQLQQDIRRCAKELTGVTAVATGNPGQKEAVFLEHSGLRIPARHASEGLRALLFLLLIVHSPEPPPLFAIEDLEAGIHPRRIEDVIGFLRRLTQRENGPQVIITSHSPLVLDQFRDVPEQVIVVERGADGTSTCTSLADRLTAIEGIDQGTALGDLWYSGVLGGVPTK